jgi:hypothetical protein
MHSVSNPVYLKYHGAHKANIVVFPPGPRIPIQCVQMANQVFSIVNGCTVYYKNRSAVDYQYSEEEIIMLKLSAKPG